MLRKKILFILLVVSAGVIFSSCEKNKAQKQPEKIIGVIENTVDTLKNESGLNSIDPEIAKISNVRVYTKADFAGVEPIFEIDLALVEGGSMDIRGKMVSLDSFYMNKYELTWQMARRAYVWGYDQGYLNNAYNLKDDKTNYVINLDTYLNSMLLCNYLSILDGYKPVYYKSNKKDLLLKVEDAVEILWIREGEAGINFIPVFIDWEADGYRLPTESEWEYAARGGKQSNGYIYAGSNSLDEVAWFELYSGESNIKSYVEAPAGQKKSNELGLYDMSGNAAEWVINPWQPKDMMVPEHNPGRIEQYNNENYIIVKGGSTSGYSISMLGNLDLYMPTTRTVSFTGSPGEENRNDIVEDLVNDRENAIRLVRSKLP